MKKYFALTIFALFSLPARAGIFDLMIYGPPDRYGQAFAQFAASTTTAGCETAALLKNFQVPDMIARCNP